MAVSSPHSITSELITAAQVEDNMSCYICWDAFLLDESVSRLVCAHIFHQACITPWLQLHATCPICRRRLLPPAPASPLRFSQLRLSPLRFTPLRLTPATTQISPTFTPESETNTPTSSPLSYGRQWWLARASDSSSSSSETSMDGCSMESYFDY